MMIIGTGMNRPYSDPTKPSKPSYSLGARREYTERGKSMLITLSTLYSYSLL
jgi:hypothetical protein